MTTPAALNEYSQAGEPARVLLERLGWTYAPREALAAERSGEREVLLKGRLRAALLRLNDWLTEEQAERAIFELENVNAVGMARNQAVHEYLTFGLPLTVNTRRGQDTRNVRFFDFDHPECWPQRVRGHHPVTGAPGQREERYRRRPAGDQARSGAVRQRHPAGGDGSQVAVADGRVEVPGGAATAPLPGGRAGVARRWRARSCSTTTCSASPTAGPPRPTPPWARRRTPTSSGSPWRRIH